MGRCLSYHSSSQGTKPVPSPSPQTLGTARRGQQGASPLLLRSYLMGMAGWMQWSEMKEVTGGKGCGQTEMVKGRKNRASSKFMDDKRIDSFSPRGRTCLFSTGGKLCCDIIPLCTRHVALTAEGGGIPSQRKPTQGTHWQPSISSWEARPGPAHGQGRGGGMPPALSPATSGKINTHSTSIYVKSPTLKH